VSPDASNSAHAYELFAYPGFAYSATHPARLEVVGRLFGLNPAPAEHARVLELGCGDGGNLLSLAVALAGSRLLGIDAAAGAIARGSELARAAGIENAALRCLDLEALPDDLGEFDYILSHGVYSWIPPRARAALLAALRRHLAPEGIAYVSYNAYPGSYLRDMARDILAYHVRGIEDPQRKLAAAQELMRTIVAIEEPTPYARMLREHMERMLRYSDALLFHDDLAEVATPFYLHEFVEHANHHHLAFLAEANLSESQMREVPEGAGRLMAQLPEDVVVREQYLDFFKNRMFRQTLLCHADAPVSRELDEIQIEGFAISSQAQAEDAASSAEQPPLPPSESSPQPPEPCGETFTTPGGYTLTTSEPLVRAAMHVLVQAWPAAVDFSTLLAAAQHAAGPQAPAELVRARLRAVLLQAHLAQIVQLGGCAPLLATQPGDRPLASPLARAQCAAGLPAVSSLLHTNVRLESEEGRCLLVLLDGTRDRAALLESLAMSEPLDDALGRFAALGLLQA
jgi:SAM-dependent methyltransferase